MFKDEVNDFCDQINHIYTHLRGVQVILCHFFHTLNHFLSFCKFQAYFPIFFNLSLFVGTTLLLCGVENQ